MAGSQQHQVSSSGWQQAGYKLGMGFKKAGAWWAGVEKRLIQRAGAQGQMMKTGLLLFKVVLAAVAIIAGMYALVWVALIAAGLVAIAFGSASSDRDSISADDDAMYSCRPDGYYTGSFRDSDD